MFKQTYYEYELQLVQYMFVLSQNQRRVVWPVGCVKYADRKYRRKTNSKCSFPTCLPINLRYLTDLLVELHLNQVD